MLEKSKFQKEQNGIFNSPKNKLFSNLNFHDIYSTYCSEMQTQILDLCEIEK